MGKQVPIAMTEQDEVEFLAFLRTTADIRVFRHSAPTVELLSVDDLSQKDQECWQFFVWNTAFPWQPSFAQVSADAPVIERRGWAYIRNTGTAPVLEYVRHNFSDGGVEGRVYWAKFFVAPNGLSYDVAAFERWYDSVARWLRKHGRRPKSEQHAPYFFPNALALRGKAL